LRDIPPKSPEDDSGIAEPSDPSKMPDEFGYVAVPPDWSAYMPQSEVIAAETPSDLGITVKKMKVILHQYDQNRIRWTRPLKKDGTPRSNRCCIHLNDWKAYVRRITGIHEDGSPVVPPDEIKVREQAIGIARLIDGKGK
ncbi:MAG: hypothetical protein ACKVK6_16875, partial [bacterium]